MSNRTNIVLPENDGCAFCAYLGGERPYTVLFRTHETATLVTREQRGEPHLLVVPLRHMTTILELTDAEASAVAIAVREAAKAIDCAYSRAGIAVWQNNGVPAGQAIRHVHFHVAGTLNDGGTNWGRVKEISVSETDAIAERLRNSVPPRT